MITTSPFSSSTGPTIGNAGKSATSLEAQKSSYRIDWHTESNKNTSRFSKSNNITSLYGLKSYEIGANSFVQNPVDFAEFAETVARLGIYWLAINEPPHH